MHLLHPTHQRRPHERQAHGDDFDPSRWSPLASRPAQPGHPFGDIADPASAVSSARRDPRHYRLLEALGTRPRTSYLARIEEGAPAMKPEPLLHDTGHFLPRDLSDQQVSRQVFGPLQQFPRRVAWRWMFGVGVWCCC
jgi:hypothetical protein